MSYRCLAPYAPTMPDHTAYFPVVYIRGYAMTEEEVEDTFNKPYYGFNLGSV